MAVIVRGKKTAFFRVENCMQQLLGCSAIPVLNDFPKSEAISVSIIREQCSEERTVHNNY